MIQTNRFQFGLVRFFRTKTGLARFWLSFFRFDLVFPIWLDFFRFDLVFFLVFFSLDSIRFGFFGFKLIKLKPNRTDWFFQNFNQFFFTVWFFRLFFFSGFLDFLDFSIFFSPLIKGTYS